MKISAPDRLLDRVDVVALRQWFMDNGFRDIGHRTIWREDNIALCLSADMRGKFSDWKHRLLDAIETCAELRGETAAELFASDMFTHPAYDRLRKIMPSDEVYRWLYTPNESFEGQKPSDAGMDRILLMIYELESGQPG